VTRPTNLGCGRAPSSAITWFFENVDAGIVLEDDCLPSPYFFPFCSSLLDKYKDEPKVGHIGGFNVQFGRNRGAASYYFSRYFHCWGWASWRRAWEGFDFHMKDYAHFLEEGALENLFERPSVREFWKDNFDAVLAGDGSVWDYQWVFHNFRHERLAIVPNQNLIDYIGFGTEATHTHGRRILMPGIETPLTSEIVHPQFLLPSREGDDFTYRKHLRLGRFHDVKRFIKKMLRVRR
jgi:hypothetical protein